MDSQESYRFIGALCIGVESRHLRGGSRYAVEKNVVSIFSLMMLNSWNEKHITAINAKCEKMIGIIDMSVSNSLFLSFT